MPQPAKLLISERKQANAPGERFVCSLHEWGNYARKLLISECHAEGGCDFCIHAVTMRWRHTFSICHPERSARN